MSSTVLAPTGKRRPPNAGKGRVKGVPNKVTREFRETVRKLLEDNSENVGRWLGQVAKEDPGKALDLLAKLAEFAAPKLGRMELAGDPNKPLMFQQIEMVVVDPDKG